jgi:hypothetical protein
MVNINSTGKMGWQNKEALDEGAHENTDSMPNIHGFDLKGSNNLFH